MTDNEQLSLWEIFRATFQAKPAWQPMPPPKEGHYLVSVTTTPDEGENVLRFTRLCYFNGASWPRMGGYVNYVAWMYMPEPL